MVQADKEQGEQKGLVGKELAALEEAFAEGELAEHYLGSFGLGPDLGSDHIPGQEEQEELADKEQGELVEHCPDSFGPGSDHIPEQEEQEEQEEQAALEEASAEEEQHRSSSDLGPGRSPVQELKEPCLPCYRHGLQRR
ncbi:hypothetical protein EDC05_006086 [Coemansia umbellata]|uniref:Uncharacterized protein n=1 Tax=Coemansia umbellata TaxID=1424467 RepID=A0ABQ8PDR2_9FUNG|nr:hypothetical protein EDC05_006086 [Coemansia umbellata]